MMHRTGLLLLLWMMIALGTVPMAWAVQQSRLDLLGVSTDLSTLGIAETWKDEGKGTYHCEIRLYRQNQWQPVHQNVLDRPATNESEFEQQCKELQQQVKQKNDLSAIIWDLAPVSPPPPAIRDKHGQLIPAETMLQSYPQQQEYSFILPPEAPWQVVLKTSVSRTRPEDTHLKAPYTLVIRPLLEPIPYEVVRGTYEPGQYLLVPYKMLINNHYGLVTLMLRDLRQDAGDVVYHYRPYFFKWPEYPVMSVDEAKNILTQTTDYAMGLDPMDKEPNALHPSYRAFMRLKAEKIPQAELETMLQLASPAGKLYVLALLHAQDPNQYQAVFQSMLKDAAPSVEIIHREGTTWESKPFRDMLLQQAKMLQ